MEPASLSWSQIVFSRRQLDAASRCGCFRDHAARLEKDAIAQSASQAESPSPPPTIPPALIQNTLRMVESSKQLLAGPIFYGWTIPPYLRAAHTAGRGISDRDRRGG